MERRSLIEYLGDFRAHGSDTAFVHQRGYRTVRWSYREVADSAHRFARELEACKIKQGDHVLIWGENCAEWVIAFFGCALRGAVAVPVDSIAAPDFALRVSTQVRAKFLVCGREVASAGLGLPVLIFDNFREKLARHPASPYAGPDLQREDVLEIVFTSGTTSEPRGVVITHGNV